MKTIALYCLFAALMFLHTSCEVVGGIFKAGMVWGILLVVIVLATVIGLIAKGKR